MDIRKQFWMAACAAFFVCGGTAMAQEADKDMPEVGETLQTRTFLAREVGTADHQPHGLAAQPYEETV